MNFPTVKKVIYSTCSLHHEENEEVIDEVLTNVKDAYRLVPVKDLLENNWTNFSSKKYKCGDKCLYSQPNVDLCNGFFIAIFERNFEVPLPECKYKGGNVKRSCDVTSNTKPDNVPEKMSHKRKKRGKRKNKEKSLADDEQPESKKSKNTVEKLGH